jgi:hypothetical protein
VKTRPILFKAEMVRAILAGEKTQTRRLVKSAHLNTSMEAEEVLNEIVRNNIECCCPYGHPGDRLWVKETWRAGMHPELFCAIQYRADNHWMKPEGLDDNTGYKFAYLCYQTPEKWYSSIFMRREFSRITLEITGVRVERLQEITRE